MDNLIKAIKIYTNTLEQQLAALEARVEQLEQQIHNCEGMSQLKQQLAEQAAQIAVLQSMPTTQASAQEPEVEIELIMDEEQEILLTQETEPSTESKEDVEFIIDTEDLLEQSEATENLEIPEPIVAQEPIAEPERVEEAPIPAPITPKVEARPIPQQTSLFGAAVEDIRQAISLGDRFLFQRELFAGNGELMQQTLDELNALSTLEEAMKHISENFDWETDSTAAQLFENVLRRRFS
jgi:hypothetical protein